MKYQVNQIVGVDNGVGLPMQTFRIAQTKKILGTQCYADSHEPPMWISESKLIPVEAPDKIRDAILKDQEVLIEKLKKQEKENLEMKINIACEVIQYLTPKQLVEILDINEIIKACGEDEILEKIGCERAMNYWDATRNYEPDPRDQYK